MGPPNQPAQLISMSERRARAVVKGLPSRPCCKGTRPELVLALWMKEASAEVGSHVELAGGHAVSTADGAKATFIALNLFKFLGADLFTRFKLTGADKLMPHLVSGAAWTRSADAGYARPDGPGSHATCSESPPRTSPPARRGRGVYHRRPVEGLVGGSGDAGDDRGRAVCPLILWYPLPTVPYSDTRVSKRYRGHVGNSKATKSLGSYSCGYRAAGIPYGIGAENGLSAAVAGRLETSRASP